jgi:hypothetical protein
LCCISHVSCSLEKGNKKNHFMTDNSSKKRKRTSSTKPSKSSSSSSKAKKLKVEVKLRTAYQYFTHEAKTLFADEVANLSISEFSTFCSGKWRDMSQDQKQPYEDMRTTALQAKEAEEKRAQERKDSRLEAKKKAEAALVAQGKREAEVAFRKELNQLKTRLRVCMQCKTNEPCMVFMPCRHLATCFECCSSSKSLVCPACKNVAKSIGKILLV